MLIPPLSDLSGGGAVVQGSRLVIREWPASGSGQDVAPLHVHREDDEAWLPKRLDDLISRLHEVDRADHPAVYAEYESQLLE